MKLLTKYRETLDSDDFFCFKPWIDESGKRHFNLKKVLRHFKHGAHIFHTNNKRVWEYITQFAEFNRFTNSPVANYKGELYSLPFNMYTFNKMWGVVTPEEASVKIEEQRKEAGITEPKNLEEQAISLVGRDIYEKLIKGYTEKQWGRDCKDLPSFIIKRLPVRLTFDNNYFNALYQGIPVGGYTKMVANLLDGIEVRLNMDYLDNKAELDALADKVVYTGAIDDAIEAGFNKVVFIIRKDIENEFKEVIGDRIAGICSEHNVTVDYAFQDINDIPGVLPEGRTKPWGTGQAVLAAKEDVAAVKESFSKMLENGTYKGDLFSDL